MSGFVNTLDVVGDEALMTSIVNRSITTISDDTVSIIGSHAFYACTKLSKADLPAVTKLEANAFRECSALRRLILRNTDQVVSLNSQFDFYDTPIKSGTGYIYVPAALIEDYKVATNWSTYASKFRVLEDYTVDGTTTGELDTSKI